MLSPDNDIAASQIVSFHQMRRRERAGHFNRMEEMKRNYNGEDIVALPELDDAEKPAIANLIAQGIDQFSMRVASVMPDVLYYPIRPGIQASTNKARDRRMANLGWWEMNKMQTKVRRRARHLTAYGMSVVSLSPVSIDPRDKREIPHWRVRNPLNTFPAPMLDPDSMEPTDCIFTDHRPLGWLQENFPQAMSRLHKDKDADAGTMYKVLEYLDDNETVVIVVGDDRKQDRFSTREVVGSAYEVLSRVKNRSGICPVVIAGRITLDRLQGQFDQMLGMYKREAKLDALNTIAVFRNVFPDEWITTPPNATRSADVIVEADGKLGIRGQVNGGQIQVIHRQQNQDGAMAMDRLERAQRLTGMIPSDFGGESGSNIRTARRGDSVLGSTIDMPLQEYHEILESSMECENYRAVKIMKAYYGNKPSMFFMGQDGKVEKDDYTPNDTFEVNICEVEYAAPGSDANGLAVRVGQKVGIGVMSKETAMSMDPDIKDPTAERDRIEIEGLRQSLLVSLEQQVTSGALDSSIIARIAKKKRERHMTLEDAVDDVHNEMKKEQADQANAQPQDQAQPEQQPGIGVSPDNPVQGPTPQGAPPLDSLLAQLHGPSGKGVPPSALGTSPSPSTKIAVG